MKNQNVIGLLLLAPLGCLGASAIAKRCRIFSLFSPRWNRLEMYTIRPYRSPCQPCTRTHRHYERNSHTSHDRYFQWVTHGVTIQYGRTRASNFSSKCVCTRTFSMLVFFKYRQGRSARLPIGTKSLAFH